MGVGHPKSREGGAHVAKHYLSPDEAWDDFADEVAPADRPRVNLSNPFEWRWPWDEVNKALTPQGDQHFDVLARLFERAYLPIVERRIASCMQDGWWHRDRDDVYIAPLGEGLIVEVYIKGEFARMRTAYRRVGASLSQPRHEPSQRRGPAFRERGHRHIARRAEIGDGGES